MPRFHPELEGTNRAFPGSAPAPAPAVGLPWAGGSAAGGRAQQAAARHQDREVMLERPPGGAMIF